mgnify:CR=1 FL=1
MKKILTFLILFFCLSAFSQQDTLVTVEINASNLTEALNQIEKQTSYTFFYQKKWLYKSNVSINKTFEKNSISEVLKFVFNDTNLNFYLHKNQIILTENSVIYSNVADDFIEPKNVSTTTIKPLLIQETQKSNINTDDKNDDLIVIGKESVNKQKVLYEISGYVINKKNETPVAPFFLACKIASFNSASDFNPGI